MKNINFDEITTRLETSSRGGGIEIDLTSLGYSGHLMSAYQNYLGGGLLSAIQNSCTKLQWKDEHKLLVIAEKLSRYFYSLTNPETEWEGTTFEKLQNRPVSAY